jgi:hypothetical protein
VQCTLGSIPSTTKKKQNKNTMDWGYSSEIECLPSIHKVLVQSSEQETNKQTKKLVLNEPGQ